VQPPIFERETRGKYSGGSRPCTGDSLGFSRAAVSVARGTVLGLKDEVVLAFGEDADNAQSRANFSTGRVVV
jgi:hypothetical protein